MAGSGSEKRRRPVIRKARFTEQEAALIDEQAERAGVSVASVIRYAVLGQTPLRQTASPKSARKPPPACSEKWARSLPRCADAQARAIRQKPIRA
jgi:hypothetical protein